MSNLQRTEAPANAPARLSIGNLLPRDGAIIRLLIIVVALFVIFSLIRPDSFPTARNAQSMALQASEIGILAVAVALTMLTGGIDLSINSTANLTGILAGSILTAMAMPGAPPEQAGLAIALAVVVSLAVGLLCGAFNGFLIAYVGIPPILATLGTLTLYQGIGTVITRGAAVFGQERLVYLGNGQLLGIIPVPLAIFLITAAVVGFVLNRTRFGFEVYLLGTNPKASRFSGINNRGVLMRTYIISGILSALAGLLILGRNNAARVDFGESYILLAIMICVLGGIDPAGGFGRIIGVVLALVALQFLSTGLNMALFEQSGANFFKEFAWGATLLLVLLLNYFSNNRRRRTAGER
jgi:simple sugar transport system permease protein